MGTSTCPAPIKCSIPAAVCSCGCPRHTSNSADGASIALISAASNDRMVRTIFECIGNTLSACESTSQPMASGTPSNSSAIWSRTLRISTVWRTTPRSHAGSRRTVRRKRLVFTWYICAITEAVNPMGVWRARLRKWVVHDLMRRRRVWRHSNEARSMEPVVDEVSSLTSIPSLIASCVLRR
jgi:hypothetical protein